jgi:hypothetical protein
MPVNIASPILRVSTLQMFQYNYSLKQQGVS